MVLELPPGYRTVFNLYVFEEWSHKEIAVKLRINEKSSSSQLTRAKRLLMKKVNEYMNKKK
jgi:RNA polymerase sigma-70 factor (ECF subfamily)